MAFSNVNRAVSKTGSTLDATLNESLRDDADLEIKDLLETAYGYPPFDYSGSTPAAVETASVSWTCRNILQRMKLNGDAAKVVRAGNYYEVNDIDLEIKRYDDKGRSAINRYIMGQPDFSLLELT